MEWQPIEAFDYETERAKQATIFVAAWVTDGKQVTLAEHWGPRVSEGDDHGWREALNIGPEGPDPLDFEPTHWMGKPEPPTT